jgi:hypothetical protein
MRGLAERLQVWRLTDSGVVPVSSSARQGSGTNGAEDNDNVLAADR